MALGVRMLREMGGFRYRLYFRMKFIPAGLSPIKELCTVLYGLVRIATNDGCTTSTVRKPRTGKLENRQSLKQATWECLGVVFSLPHARLD